MGALLWGVVFRAPALLFFGTVPLLLTFIVLERLGIKRLWAYLGVWTTGGLVATGMSSGSASMIAALLSSAIVAYLYWLLAGRSAGEWVAARIPGERNAGYRLLNYAAYGILAFLGYQLVGYLYYGAKLYWVSHISEPGRGVPPFQIRPNRQLTAAQKVALMDFPDPESCLKDGVKTLTPENLKKLDWDRIDNASDAEVCVFRLLGSYEDLSQATAWFEAQGFDVPKSFSSAKPFPTSDGKLRVYGSYSIRKSGPKFPTRGVIRRLFRSIPYAMNVDSTWSEDGKQLLFVSITFNTL